MIVIGRKFGRLANRLYLFAYAIACARETGTTVMNPAFSEYAGFFRGTCQDRLCRYPAQRSWFCHPWQRELSYLATYLPTRALAALRLTRWPCPIIRLRGEDIFDLESAEFRERLRRGGRVVLHGWNFRDQGAFFRQAEAIREYFRPVESREAAIEQTIAKARQRADVVVGVHIRQGDYARFRGGQYYYTSRQYAHLMVQVQHELRPRSCLFLVGSDSPQSPDGFPGVRVQFGTGHPVDDLYAFSRCDYLIGPPSTYSMWASFYGRVPLLTLDQPAKRPRLNQFVTACYETRAAAA